MRVGCSCRPKLHLVWCRRRARRPEQITRNRTLQALADWDEQTSYWRAHLRFWPSLSPLCRTSLSTAPPLSSPCPMPSNDSLLSTRIRSHPPRPRRPKPLRYDPRPSLGANITRHTNRIVLVPWPLVAAASNRFFLRSSTRQDLPSSRCPPRSSGRRRQHRRRPP